MYKIQELIVFVSPIYYYNFSAQLKKVIDRLYAIDEELHTKKEVILLATAYNLSLIHIYNSQFEECNDEIE